MDKDHKLFMNEHTWNSFNFSMEIESNDNCFFSPNWDNSMDQSDPFESALSSIVTSPAASNASVIHRHPPLHSADTGDNLMIRELIGRLGNICNSGEISSPSYFQQSHNNSTSTSCYSTPLNSPPKVHLSTMDSQIRGNLPIPGFAERAARLSCFGSKNGLSEIEMSHKLIHRPESGKLSRVSSTQSMKVAVGSHQENNRSSPQDGNSGSDKKFNARLSRSSTPGNGELGDSKQECSVSEQIPGAQNDVKGRKRKSIPRGKTKTKETTPPSSSSSPSTNDAKVVSETEESHSKRSKQDENDGNQKQNKDNSKPPEPPKDYIHVRARRGQATDSHSLAERVRREKISERMKFLQDLVPGCNKVTGKAVMLDEIINYVQSLQRQVEFLSMKLSTVNTRMDFNMEALLSKDKYQSRGSVYPRPIESSAQTLFPFGYLEQAGIPLTAETQLFSINNNPLNSSLHRNQNLQLPPPSINGGGYTEAASQVPLLWEDDLQSLVQMGFNQNQSQSFNGGSIATVHTEMKIEM